jgi:hypothetical protein
MRSARGVDLEQLRGHLLQVVRETIQLAHVSLWLCLCVEPLSEREDRDWGAMSGR